MPFYSLSIQLNASPNNKVKPDSLQINTIMQYAILDWSVPKADCTTRNQIILKSPTGDLWHHYTDLEMKNEFVDVFCGST